MSRAHSLASGWKSLLLVAALLSAASLQAAADASGAEPRYGMTFNLKTFASSWNTSLVDTSAFANDAGYYVRSMNGFALDLSKCKTKPTLPKGSGASNLFGGGGNAVAISVYAKMGNEANAVLWALSTTDSGSRAYGPAFKNSADGTGIAIQWLQNSLESATVMVEKSAEFLAGYHHYVMLFNKDASLELYIDGEQAWTGTYGSRNFAGKAYNATAFGTRYNAVSKEPLLSDEDVAGNGVIDDFRTYLSTTENAALTAEQIKSLYESFVENAEVVWDDPVTISADTDVATKGTKHFAFCARTRTKTVNGVDFNQMYSWGASDWWDDYFLFDESTSRGDNRTTGVAATDSLSSEFIEALSGYRGVASLPATMKLMQLTPNRWYLVQVFLNNSSLEGADSGKVEIGVGGSVKTLSYNASGTAGGLGQSIIGRFRARGTTQRITFDAVAGGATDALVNMVQVRLLPSTDAVWSGDADGEWNATGKNWDGFTAEDTLFADPEGYSYDAYVMKDGAEVAVVDDVLVQNLVIADTNLTFEAGAKGRIAVSGAKTITANGLVSVNVTNSVVSVSAGLSAPVLSKEGNGGLSLTGNLAVETIKVAAGDVMVGGTDGFAVVGEPVTATGNALVRSQGYTFRLDLAGERVLSGLGGSGTLNLSANQTVAIDGSSSSMFVGTISGTGGLTKSGDGELVLVGTNTFAGAFSVAAGTLRLGGIADMNGLLYDFDASMPGTLKTAEATDEASGSTYTGVTNWTCAAGLGGTLFAPNAALPVITNNVSVFAGRNFVAGDKLHFASEKTFTPLSSIFVYQVLGDPATSYATLAGDYSDDRWYIRRRNANMNYWQWSNNSNWNDGNNDMYYNGSYGSTINGQPSVLSFLDSFIRRGDKGGNKKIYFGGGGYAMAYAEMIAFDHFLSLEEKNAAEAYLMAKWGIGNAEYNVLPKAAPLVVAKGATLDLGGLEQTVASLTLGGTVKNGTLTVTGAATFTEGATIDLALDGEAAIGTKVLSCGSADGLDNLTVTVNGVAVEDLKPKFSEAKGGIILGRDGLVIIMR